MTNAYARLSAQFVVKPANHAKARITLRKLQNPNIRALVQEEKKSNTARVNAKTRKLCANLYSLLAVQDI
jgi:hypothetical protein